MSAFDPGRRWTCARDDGFSGTRIAIPRDHELELAFEPAWLAQVEFVGDEVLFVATAGVTQGFSHALDLRLASAPDADASGKQPSTYLYYFRPPAKLDPSGSPSLAVRVYTANHGYKRVEVPILPHTDAAATRVDLEQLPRVAPGTVTVRVRSMHGEPADVGVVRLQSLSDGALSLACRCNVARHVPAGHTYKVAVGAFPCSWSFPDASRLIVPVEGGAHDIDVVLTWPTVPVQLTMFLAGEAIAADEVIRCSVVGSFGPDCVGARNHLLLGGALPELAYPLGRLELQVTARGKLWRGAVDVTAGSKALAVDLR